MRWRSSWACQRSTSTARGSSADAVSAVQARSGSGPWVLRRSGAMQVPTLEGDEDARPSTRAGGLAVCTPDASQLWLERVSRLEHQSSFSVLGGVDTGQLRSQRSYKDGALACNDHGRGSATSSERQVRLEVRRGRELPSRRCSRLVLRRLARVRPLFWDSYAYLKFGISGGFPRVHERLKSCTTGSGATSMEMETCRPSPLLSVSVSGGRAGRERMSGAELVVALPSSDTSMGCTRSSSTGGDAPEALSTT